MPGINCIKLRSVSTFEGPGISIPSTTLAQKHIRVKFQRSQQNSNNLNGKITAKILSKNELPEDCSIAEEFADNEEPIHKDLARREIEKAYKLSRLANNSLSDQNTNVSRSKADENFRERSVSAFIPSVISNGIETTRNHGVFSRPNESKRKYTDQTTKTSIVDPKVASTIVQNVMRRTNTSSKDATITKSPHKSATFKKPLKVENGSPTKSMTSIHKAEQNSNFQLKGITPSIIAPPTLTKPTLSNPNNKQKFLSMLASIISPTNIKKQPVSSPNQNKAIFDELNQMQEIAEKAIKMAASPLKKTPRNDENDEDDNSRRVLRSLPAGLPNAFSSN